MSSRAARRAALAWSRHAPVFQEPGQPGYPPEGDEAARTSVLSPAPAAPGEIPFLQAPNHLAALLMPQLSHTGAAWNDGSVCIRAVRGTWRRSAPDDRLLVYPGDGRTGVAPVEVARELPSTPGQEVGIAQGTPTGPSLLLLPDGPWAASSLGGMGSDGVWSFGGRRVEVTRARLEGPAARLARSSSTGGLRSRARSSPRAPGGSPRPTARARRR